MLMPASRWRYIDIDFDHPICSPRLLDSSALLSGFELLEATLLSSPLVLFPRAHECAGHVLQCSVVYVRLEAEAEAEAER